MQDLLTVSQFADAAGISKQAVYKALNNKLKPFVQLVDGKKMLQNKALQEIYGVEINHPENQPGGSQDQPSQPWEALIAMLQKELDAKNEQIKELTDLLATKDRQIENLTSSLDNTTSSLQVAQALHAGTLQQQLQAPVEPEVEQPGEQWSESTEKEKKTSWFTRFLKKE